MISDAIIVALITGVCAVVGQLLISRNSTKDLFSKLDSKFEKYQAVTDNKIEELTREVRAHNGHSERIALLEAEDKRLNERLKVVENKPA